MPWAALPRLTSCYCKPWCTDSLVAEPAAGATEAIQPRGAEGDAGVTGAGGAATSSHSASCSLVAINRPTSSLMKALSKHDCRSSDAPRSAGLRTLSTSTSDSATRSEEHTSELQSQFHLLSRLLLQKISIL